MTLGHRLYDRVAIYGATKELTETILQILGTAPDQSKVKYFHTREEAVQWLKGEK